MGKYLVCLRPEKEEGEIKSKKLIFNSKIITSIFMYYENVFQGTSKIESDNIHHKVKDEMLNYAVYRMMFKFTKLRFLDKNLSDSYLDKLKTYLKKTPISPIIKFRIFFGLSIFNTFKKGHQIIHVKSLSLK